LHYRHVLAQRHERGLATEHDFAAVLGNQGQKARELNRVAEALLGVYENGFALQRCAVPAWSIQARRRHVWQGPALLVIGPSSFVIAVQQIEKGALKTGRPIRG